MELFCSLLTGFFLWLLLFQLRCKSIARVRQLAGNLVFAARSTRPRWVRWGFFIFFLFVLLNNIFDIILSGHHVRFHLGGQFSFAAFVALVIWLGIPATRNIAIEVREQGVLLGRFGDRVSLGSPYFVPWNQIATCQWVPKSFGTVSRFREARNCLTIAQDAISPEQKTAVTAAVGQFAVVYDHDGTLLAEPDKEHLNAKWTSWRDLDALPPQFDLQTMFLVVIVVACAANLCGLHYRSPEHQAIAKLKALDPRIDYNGHDDVWMLDFSACANKPTDDDLASLEPLTELVRLDLAGAPITDAGLTHLKGLKNLLYVNLANTGVTSKGIEDLRCALPRASIDKGVRWIPPGVVPLAPTSSKGKRRP